MEMSAVDDGCACTAALAQASTVKDNRQGSSVGFIGFLCFATMLRARASETRMRHGRKGSHVREDIVANHTIARSAQSAADDSWVDWTIDPVRRIKG